MPTLLDVQHALRDSILSGLPERATGFCAGNEASAAERLDVYRNTVFGVLTAALRVTYPAVCRLVGDEFFDAAAQVFIERSPPQCGYLNVYGAGFADFLAGFSPAASLCYLPDVAAFEWAVNGALHAPDALPMHPERLAALAALGHERVRFTKHPSLHFLDVPFPVELLWQAVLEDDDAALTRFDFAAGPRWLAIERTAGRVEIFALPQAEWLFVRALSVGETLDAAMQEFELENPVSALAAYLVAGRFTDFADMQSLETCNV